MKRTLRMLTLAVALAVLATASVTALAEYGSGAVAAGKTYTTEEMLTYAIEDEYLAQAEYQAIIAQFGALRPFTNVVVGEARHIELLKPLFTAYEVALPENDAAGRVVLPETLALVYEAGVNAENGNIAMYDAFLQQNLPDDVRAVFTALKAASQNHLASFERKSTGQTGNQQVGRGGRSNGQRRGNANSNVNGRGRGNMNSANCGAGCGYTGNNARNYAGNYAGNCAGCGYAGNYAGNCAGCGYAGNYTGNCAGCTVSPAA